MRRAYQAAVALGILLGVVGCTHPVEHGTVRSRAYVPAHNEEYTEQHLVGFTPCGKDCNMPMYTYSNETRFVGDAWFIVVGDADHESRFTVDSATYESCAEGHHFDRQDDVMSCVLQ